MKRFLCQICLDTLKVDKNSSILHKIPMTKTEEYLPSTATFLIYIKYEEYTWYSFEIGAWNIAEA